MRHLFLIVLLVLAVTVPLRAELVNRYSFTTGDTDVVDSVGDKHGTLEGDAAIAGNQLVLTGDGYVMLAGDVLDDYTSASLEAWYTDDAVSGWARVFDFGDTGDGAGGFSWFYTPSGPGNTRLVIGTEGFPTWGTGEIQINGPVIEVGAQNHIVAIFDETGGPEGTPAMFLYHNGELVGSANDTSPHLLENVARVYAYLGRATYTGDPYLVGSIAEFRVYSAPLDSLSILLNAQLGPDVYQPCVYESLWPANNAERVSRTPLLNWTAKDGFAPSEYRIYLGTDPNILDPNAPGGIEEYLIAVTEETSYHVMEPLEFDEVNYWRVDAIIDGQEYVGPALSFTTTGQAPVVLEQPERVVANAGEDVTFAVKFYSFFPASYEWYRALDPDNPDPAVDVLLASGTAFDPEYEAILELSDVQVSDEGYYYSKMQSQQHLVTLSDVVTLGIRRNVAYWTLDEADYVDGSYLDVSGEGHHAEPNGVITFVDAMVGQGVQIAPEDGWANAGTWDPSEYSGLLSVSLWAKWDGENGWQGLIAKRNSWAAENMMWMIELASGSGNVDFKNTAATVGSAPLPVDEWEHVVVTFDGSTAIIYRNGLVAAEGSFSFTERTDANLVIGASEITDAGEVGLPFNGALDEVKLYNYPIDSMDIALEYTGITGETVCYDRPALDFTGDCRVGVADLAEFVEVWLDCAIVPDCLPF